MTSWRDLFWYLVLAVDVLAAALLLALVGVALALLLGGCACPASRPPRALRLEGYEDCVHSAAMFCQRSVSPSDACLSRLVEEYCQ